MESILGQMITTFSPLSSSLPLTSALGLPSHTDVCSPLQLSSSPHGWLALEMHHEGGTKATFNPIFILLPLEQGRCVLQRQAVQGGKAVLSAALMWLSQDKRNSCPWLHPIQQKSSSQVLQTTKADQMGAILVEK